MFAPPRIGAVLARSGMSRRRLPDGLAEQRHLLAEGLPHRLLPRGVELRLDVPDARAQVTRRRAARRSGTGRTEMRELRRDLGHRWLQLRGRHAAVDQVPLLGLSRRDGVGEERHFLRERETDRTGEQPSGAAFEWETDAPE